MGQLQEQHYDKALTKIILENFDLENAGERPGWGGGQPQTSKLFLSKKPFGLVDLLHVLTPDIITTIEFYKAGDGEKARTGVETSDVLGTYDIRYQLRVEDGRQIDPKLLESMRAFAAYVEHAAFGIKEKELAAQQKVMRDALAVNKFEQGKYASIIGW